MGPEPTLDPDLEQVLEDIAADPRSKLFVTDPRKLLTGLQDGSLETPPSRTGLRPAERHLLEVYRHELAFLLRQVYLAGLEQRDTSIVIAHRRPDDGELRFSLGQVLDGTSNLDRHAEPLRHANSWTTVDELDPLVTLAMSLRVEVAHQSRIHLANEYAERDQPRSALGLANEVIRDQPTRQLLGYAQMSLGASQDLLGEKSRALASYKSAFDNLSGSSAEEALIASTNSLRLSAEIGELHSGLAAARWIDECFSPSDQALLCNKRALQNSGHKTPPHAKVQEQLIESTGSSAREILHALY